MKIEKAIKQTEFKNELQKLIINILYTGSWLGLKSTEMLRPYNLTSQQYNVLRILRGQYPKPATVNLIIERMLDKTSNASRIVDKLIDKELVSRTYCATDRRCVDVQITEKGMELLSEIDKVETSWRKKFNHISESEAKKINSLLDKFRELNQKEK